MYFIYSMYLLYHLLNAWASEDRRALTPAVHRPSGIKLELVPLEHTLCMCGVKALCIAMLLALNEACKLLLLCSIAMSIYQILSPIVFRSSCALAS